MDYQSVIISKLGNFINEIHRLRFKDFPYQSPKTALCLLEKHFKAWRDELTKFIKSLPPGSPSLRHLCHQIQSDIGTYMPIVGIIANSANVRTVFEMYEPIWQMASEILEPTKNPRSADINLILSSEWELSPFVFGALPFTEVLRNFIIIGLPASECSNPLLAPLAGHELGHVVWKKNNLSKTLQPRINEIIMRHLSADDGKNGMTLFANQEKHEKYTMAAQMAIKQAEEVFCDFLGLRLFGRAYVLAFYYLLAPWTDNSRCATYPLIRQRFGLFKKAAAEYKFDFPENLLLEEPFACGPCQQDCPVCAARDGISPILMEEANNAASRAKGKEDFAGSTAEVVRIKEKFKQNVPAAGIKTLSDIVNAGWAVYAESPCGNLRPTETLMDLIAKNFEILSIEERLKKEIL